MGHLSVVAAALLSAAWFAPAVQALPQHQHEHAAAPAPVAVPTQRWTPDAPLRAGMRAATVETAVTSMFANCKLSAEPDAALHGILVPLLAAAQALQADPDNTKPVADMRAAIAHYPHYFNDPGWDKPATVDVDEHSEL